MDQMVIGIVIGLATALLVAIFRASWLSILKATLLRKDSNYQKYRVLPFKNVYVCGYCLDYMGRISKMKYYAPSSITMGGEVVRSLAGHGCPNLLKHDVEKYERG